MLAKCIWKYRLRIFFYLFFWFPLFCFVFLFQRLEEINIHALSSKYEDTLMNEEEAHNQSSELLGIPGN